MPQPIERVKREAMRAKGGNFGCTSFVPFAVETTLSYLHRIEFPVSMPARYGRKDGKAELGSFVFRGGGAFSDLRKGHLRFRRSENPPSGPVEVALFRIKVKKNYRELRLERFSAERRSNEAPPVR